MNRADNAVEALAHVATRAVGHAATAPKVVPAMPLAPSSAMGCAHTAQRCDERARTCGR